MASNGKGSGATGTSIERFMKIETCQKSDRTSNALRCEECVCACVRICVRAIERVRERESERWGENEKPIYQCVHSVCTCCCLRVYFYFLLFFIVLHRYVPMQEYWCAYVFVLFSISFCVQSRFNHLAYKHFSMSSFVRSHLSIKRK